MFKLDSNARLYPLWTILIGFVSFLIAAAVMGMIPGEGVVLVFGAPVGSLLMLFLLGKLNSRMMLYKTILLTELGTLAGTFLGLMVGYAISGILGSFIPSMADLSTTTAQLVPNMVMLIGADAIFGAVIGYLVFEKKAIGFFALVCGIVSIPFGILLSMPIKLIWSGFDLNLIFMLISFGTTSGLAIGLYQKLKLKNNA